jgi:hypothetical protein
MLQVFGVLAFVLTDRGLLGDMGFDMGYIYIYTQNHEKNLEKEWFIPV